jgi:hypothetical protein
MDCITNLVSRVRDNRSFAMKDMKAERPLMPWRHCKRQAKLEREVDDDEPLDLEPLHVKMPNEEMQEALSRRLR